MNLQDKINFVDSFHAAPDDVQELCVSQYLASKKLNEVISGVKKKSVQACGKYWTPEKDAELLRSVDPKGNKTEQFRTLKKSKFRSRTEGAIGLRYYQLTGGKK